MSNEELSIGAFARLTNLTQKALRVYERDGLLTPARVDSHNGYRWYSTEQQLTTWWIRRDHERSTTA